MATLTVSTKEKVQLLEAVKWVQANGGRPLYAPPDFTEVTEADAKAATARSVSRLLSQRQVEPGLRVLVEEKLLIRHPDLFCYRPNPGQRVGIYRVGKTGRGFLQGFQEGQEAAEREQKHEPPVSPGRQLPSWLKYDILRATERRSMKFWHFDCFWAEPDLSKWPEGTGLQDFWTLVVRAVRQSGSFRPLGTSCHCGWVLAEFKSTTGFYVSCRKCPLWISARGRPETGATVKVDF